MEVITIGIAGIDTAAPVIGIEKSRKKKNSYQTHQAIPGAAERLTLLYFSDGWICMVHALVAAATQPATGMRFRVSSR